MVKFRNIDDFKCNCNDEMQCGDCSNHIIFNGKCKIIESDAGIVDIIQTKVYISLPYKILRSI